MSGAKLSDVDLSGAKLHKADLSKADLSKNKLVKATLDEAVLTGAFLTGSDLTGAELRSANLKETNLDSADLTNANLENAILNKANLVGTSLIKTNLKGANVCEANLENADLSQAKLFAEAKAHFANFKNAKMVKTVLHGADLRNANMSGTDLTTAELSGTNLEDADLSKANFYEAAIKEPSFRNVKGLPSAINLDTVQIKVNEKYLVTCVRKWMEKWLDWERLRTLGRLPLFGPSYAALIVIPIFFYGLDLYNDKVEIARAWAHQVLSDQTITRVWSAEIINDRLKPLPIPSLSLYLLIGTVLLAVGSTLYTFFCPSRVKEFSRDQWCDLLGHSLLHYWPLAWRYRWIRLLCAAAYGVGGTLVLWVIVMKVWDVVVFIYENSDIT